MSTDSQHLIHMANDIGNFFRANPDHDAAVIAISNHIKSFWTPKMRKKLIADMNGVDEQFFGHGGLWSLQVRRSGPASTPRARRPSAGGTPR